MSAQSVINKFYSDLTLESGTIIRIKKLPGREGFKTAMALSKVILPAIGTMYDSGNSEEALLGGSSFGKAAQMLTESLDDKLVDNLITSLLRNSTIQEKDAMSRDLNIDEDFMANYGDLVDVLEFALRENFESFFSGKLIGRHFKAALQAE